jgi:hypothetical protein
MGQPLGSSCRACSLLFAPSTPSPAARPPACAGESLCPHFKADIAQQQAALVKQLASSFRREYSAFFLLNATFFDQVGVG